MKIIVLNERHICKQFQQVLNKKKMNKILLFAYLISIITISLIIFNLIQVEIENIFAKENIKFIVMILAGLSCLIIMGIIIVNEKIKKIKKK